MSELPNGWTAAELPDVAFFQEGPGLRKFQYMEKGIPFLNIRTFVNGRIDRTLCKFLDPTEVEKKYRHFLVDAGDILVAISGSIGKWAVARDEDLPLVLNTSVMRFRPRHSEVLEKQYLLWFLRSPHFTDQAWGSSTGSAQKNVGPSHVQHFKILLPPPPEQRRIVAKIDSLSAKSKRARDELDHVPRLVEKYKQAILSAAFNRIEKGADENTLEQLAAHITSGSRDWSQYYDRGNCVFVLAANIKPMAFDPRPKQHVDPPLQGADAKQTLIEAGDLLFTIVGVNTGDVCYVPSAVTNYFVCQSVALVRLREPRRARFIELFLNAETAGKAQIEKLIYGQGRPHLSFADLKRLRIPVIDIGKTHALVQGVDAAFRLVDRLASEAANARKLIDHLDQSVLAKAFRGELVPQYPNDEPANVLLERIRAERQSASVPRRHRQQQGKAPFVPKRALGKH